MEIIAVFRARNQTLVFANLLRSYGVKVLVVNTPRRLSVSCGLSAKFPAESRALAEEILSRRKFDSFAGIFN